MGKVISRKRLRRGREGTSGRVARAVRSPHPARAVVGRRPRASVKPLGKAPKDPRSGGNFLRWIKSVERRLWSLERRVQQLERDTSPHNLAGYE